MKPPQTSEQRHKTVTDAERWLNLFDKFLILAVVIATVFLLLHFTGY